MLSATYITSLLLACATLTLAAPLVEPVVALQARATGDGRPPGFTFLGYDPSTPMSVVGTVAFGVLAVGLTYRQIKLKAGYMLAMTIGAWFYAAGVVLRFAVDNSPDSLGLYIVQHMFVILSPCAFIASVYSILGQISWRLGADDCLPIRATKVAKYFIWSDVITFLIQSSGGGMQVQQNLSNIGSKIFLVGLILQLISFGIFCIFIGIFFIRLRSRYPNTFKNRQWRPLAYALVVACVAVFIRSIYRTVENSQGFHGYLSIHEGYFWALDALPMAITIGLFVPYWPELYLPLGPGAHTAVSLQALSPMNSK